MKKTENSLDSLRKEKGHAKLSLTIPSDFAHMALNLVRCSLTAPIETKPCVKFGELCCYLEPPETCPRIPPSYHLALHASGKVPKQYSSSSKHTIDLQGVLRLSTFATFNFSTCDRKSWHIRREMLNLGLRSPSPCQTLPPR